MMLQQRVADDYVIATGHTNTVREFCEEAFSYVGLDYKKHVKQKQEFMRPLEVPHLEGDASKALVKFGWKPKTSFIELVHMMVDADLEKYKNPTKYSEQFLKHT